MEAIKWPNMFFPLYQIHCIQKHMSKMTWSQQKLNQNSFFWWSWLHDQEKETMKQRAPTYNIVDTTAKTVSPKSVGF